MTESNYWLEYQATPQLSSYSFPVFNERSLVICYAQFNPLAMNRRTFNEHVCRLISLVWLNQSSWNFQGLFIYKWRTYIPKIKSLSLKLTVLQHLQWRCSKKFFFFFKNSGKSNNWVLPCNPADTVPQCCYLRNWIYFTILIRKNLAFILDFKICLLRPWNWLRKVEKWASFLTTTNSYEWLAMQTGAEQFICIFHWCISHYFYDNREK
jgi:hypothetical protein